MSNSSDSLAIVIYVRNCRSKLEILTTRLLEIASELTNEIELLFVDDASDDDSDDVIWQLATRYAQVDYVRHPARCGFDASVRAGFQATTGRYLLLCDGTRLLDVERVSRLWRNRKEPQNDAARVQSLVVPPPRGNFNPKQWLRQVAQVTPAAREIGMESGVSLILKERSQLAAQLGEGGRSDNLPKSRNTKQTGVIRKAPRRPFALRKTGYSSTIPPQETPSRIFRDALERLRNSGHSH